MSMSYDEELPAGFQDADIEQAEFEAEGNRIAALRRRGVCTHDSGVSYRDPAVYPEQEGLKPGQLRCTDGCGRVFNSEADWHDARNEALGR